MVAWTPEPVWQGQDAFIIGGGTSLRGFDWTCLHGENTIGCNNAFRLGVEVCKVCLFVDRSFIFTSTDPLKPRKGFYDELAKFEGIVVTNDNKLSKRPEPWMKYMPRGHKGMFRDRLGYNFSCGAAAVNLALLFGATTVYLLGFDMRLNLRGEPNWHRYLIDKPMKDVYERMLASFGHVARSLKEDFPGCSVYNVTGRKILEKDENGDEVEVTYDSKLTLFPKLKFEEFWSERRKVCSLKSR